jgi:clorobiocin biosynthesis protein Clo-hal
MATLVKKHNPGARVLIVEKAAFPRHHVGESLLPGLIPVLKEMGVFDKINAGGFPRKIGVAFVWGKDRKPWDADFNNLNLEMIEKYGRALDTEFSWQVLRSRYDQILFEHARSCGVETLVGWRAVEPLMEGQAVRGAVLEGPGGERLTVRSRTLADCSGQNGFLQRARRTRVYREDLKNVAAYSYWKGAKWKFDYAGHPDKTKIFVCSVPEGWFWYIPLSRDLVSVGLVAKASYVKARGVKDLRRLYDSALSRCKEIRGLLATAERATGVAPDEPEKDFFTAGDWSYASESACGDGWLAAGDAAFFLDPLLSSGVMMAHLSGHRAAYTITTSWRESDPALLCALWADYDRYCKEVAGSFLALVQYWYSHDPNAKAWWKTAKTALGAGSPLDLSDKMSFVAVAAGVSYHFERAYTSQSLLFGSSGVEHSWQWEGTKLELKRWTRQILAIVETGFLKKGPRDARVARAEALVKLQRLPDAWAPKWELKRRLSVTFLPDSSRGVLEPIQRLDVLKIKTRGAASAEHAANPKRTLPASYVAILDLVDGRRSIGAIKRALYARFPLPADVLDGQVFRLLKDLAVLGALSFTKDKKAGPPRPLPRAWELFRRGEAQLKGGDPLSAEASLSMAAEAGLSNAWLHALRGEARRHLGRLAEAREDLDLAVRLNDAEGPAAGGALAARLEAFDRKTARGWMADRVLILRAKLRVQLGDMKGARADADAALQANPRQSEALVVRAKAAAALGDLLVAKADLEHALQIETAGKRNQG